MLGNHDSLYFAIIPLTPSANKTIILGSPKDSPRFGQKRKITIHLSLFIGTIHRYCSLRNFAYLRGAVPYIWGKCFLCLVQDFFLRESFPLKENSLLSPSFIQFSLSAALKEKIYQHIQEKVYQQIPRQINNVICQQEKNLQKRNLPAISCKSSKIFKKKLKINQDCIRNLPAIKKKNLSAIFEKEIKNPNYQKRTYCLNILHMGFDRAANFSWCWEF